MVNKEKILTIVKNICTFLKKIATTFHFVITNIISSFNIIDVELRKRIITGIIFAFTFLIVIFYGGVVYMLTIFIICCLMIYELIGMITSIEKTNNKMFTSLRKFGILYIIICCLSLVLIRESLQGIKITIWLFAVVWTVDTMAYIFGKRYGKLQLAPKISPKKTYEGAIVGSACGIFISIILYKIMYTNSADTLTLQSFVIFTIIIVILAQLSDLSESYIKRQCGVKDSGNLLPGHGGFLDRFDSLLLVAPLVFLVLFLNGGILF